uniref:Uncharacterized protein n=1 Tax=Acrobeloides nanus TaxID=290746 RepID=A0A914CHW4_9BILA
MKFDLIFVVLSLFISDAFGKVIKECEEKSIKLADLRCTSGQGIKTLLESISHNSFDFFKYTDIIVEGYSNASICGNYCNENEVLFEI